MVFKFLGFGCWKKHSSSSSFKTKRSYATVIEELCTPFSLADLKKATNNFDRNNLIGRGGLGHVYKGCLLLDHVATSVAVKQMSVSSIQELRDFHNEIELLCQLHHPNLVSLIGFCIHKDYNFIVYKYMSNGSLDDRIFDRESRPWKKRLEICIGAAHAVHYLHTGLKRIVIHRDIKPSNILLDENMVPKLSDFGLSIQGQLFMAKPKPIEGKPIEGTIGYLAPENLIYGTLTDKCDVYSFGLVLSEVVRGESLRTVMDKWRKYRQQPNEEIEMSNNGSESSDDINMSLPSYIMLKLQAEDIDPALAENIAPECYAAYIDIIDRCIKFDPNERPTMGEVEVLLEHALTLQQEADNAKDRTSITQPQQQEALI